MVHLYHGYFSHNQSVTQPFQVCEFTANSWASEPTDREVDVEESTGVAWLSLAALEMEMCAFLFSHVPSGNSI